MWQRQLKKKKQRGEEEGKNKMWNGKGQRKTAFYATYVILQGFVLFSQSTFPYWLVHQTARQQKAYHVDGLSPTFTSSKQ